MIFKINLAFVTVAAILSQATQGSSTDASNSSSIKDGRTNGRRQLLPSNSIAQEVSNEHAKGNSNPKFTLVGEVAGSGNNNGNPDLFSVSVYEPIPAVTKETTYSAFDGPREFVGELDHTILVADMDEEEDGTIAILSVNKATEQVNGIVQKKNGQKMKFTQTKGNKAWAFEAEEFIPPAWECGVGHEEESAAGRRLIHDGDIKEYHDHHDHDHNIGSNIQDALDHIKEGLRGSNLRIGKRRKLQTAGSYTYQVDIYVEIDQTLVNDNGGIFNPNTINYVNALFTGANTIYEVSEREYVCISAIFNLTFSH